MEASQSLDRLEGVPSISKPTGQHYFSDEGRSVPHDSPDLHACRQGIPRPRSHSWRYLNGSQSDWMPECECLDSSTPLQLNAWRMTTLQSISSFRHRDAKQAFSSRPNPSFDGIPDRNGGGANFSRQKRYVTAQYKLHYRRTWYSDRD